MGWEGREGGEGGEGGKGGRDLGCGSLFLRFSGLLNWTFITALQVTRHESGTRGHAYALSILASF